MYEAAPPEVIKKKRNIKSQFKLKLRKNLVTLSTFVYSSLDTSFQVLKEIRRFPYAINLPRQEFQTAEALPEESRAHPQKIPTPEALSLENAAVRVPVRGVRRSDNYLNYEKKRNIQNRNKANRPIRVPHARGSGKQGPILEPPQFVKVKDTAILESMGTVQEKNRSQFFRGRYLRPRYVQTTLRSL